MWDNLSYKAVILDMDGVVTDTRELHLQSWESSLNELLGKMKLVSFKNEDYVQYLDGKTREEGILAFLESRNIANPSHYVDEISKSKNKHFLSLLLEKGPKVFQDAVDAINRWKLQSIPIAIVSSSRNCTKILEIAGIRDLFKVQLNPNTVEGLHLRSKPSPDYFLKAAELLGFESKDCLLIEDALSGIEAGVRGNFHHVVGVSRIGQTLPSRLYGAGANLVVSSLDELFIERKNALALVDEIYKTNKKKEVVLFLDFDGTLSDIVSSPSDAKINPFIKSQLQKYSTAIRMTIVSGRDRQDVKERVGLPNIFYAGSHGFDISGPGCFHFQVEEARNCLNELFEATSELKDHFLKIPGLIIEEKKFFVAFHYRMVEPDMQSKVLDEITKVQAQYSTLALRHGKKVIELGPNYSWDKGQAIMKIMDVLDLNFDNYFPIYIGDDFTDEDAFIRIRGKGIGVKVNDPAVGTSADYWLRNTSEVGEFIDRLCNHFTGKQQRWRHGD